ncbi:DUF6804 family protein [Noviluteimonas dokdonensis]|uniref:DUF6804 family protein n=1 Tax=Noviluteimonas dokdonensis TaxID=414050 RepID=UPI00055FBCA2
MQPRVVLGVVVVAVAIALIPSMPYGYYRVMRWVVCVGCACLALYSLRSKSEAWAWIWGAIAGIYNPIVPVHASREIWSIANVATIVVAGWFATRLHGLERSD